MSTPYPNPKSLRNLKRIFLEDDTLQEVPEVVAQWLHGSDDLDGNLRAALEDLKGKWTSLADALLLIHNCEQGHVPFSYVSRKSRQLLRKHKVEEDTYYKTRLVERLQELT